MKTPPNERPSRATVAAGFVTGMLSGLATRPDGAARIARLLVDAGVSERVLATADAPGDSPERIGVVRYAELYNRLVRELDDEGFGLFAAPLRTGSFEFLCRSVISAATLAEALDRAARFLGLLLPDFAIRIARPKGGSAQLMITLTDASPLAARPPADPARVFAFEWLLRLLHALACWLVGRGLGLDAVHFPYPRPPHADDYALIYTENSQFFEGNATFDPAGPSLAPSSPPAETDATIAATPAASLIATPATNFGTTLSATLLATLSANLLDLPVRRDEAALTAFLHDAPGKIALLYRRDRETVQLVRDALRAALPELPALAAVARQLNLSERTLHRRLEEEGTNFRAIRDALRRDLALAKLSKTARPLATIAAELGYAEASAFYRAVVGWTGMAPSEYRKRSEH